MTREDSFVVVWVVGVLLGFVLGGWGGVVVTLNSSTKRELRNKQESRKIGQR